MKFFIPILSVLLITSCLKDNLHQPDIYWGTASAEFNGDSLAFRPFCDTDGLYLGITLDRYRSNDILQYHLNFGHIQQQAYVIDSLAAYNNSGANTREFVTLLSLLADGASVGNIYKPLESEENTLEITSWNALNNEIKGKFHCTFVLDPDWQVNDPSAPDTIRFTKGDFYTRL
jgi:hypothetical protein